MRSKPKSWKRPLPTLSFFSAYQGSGIPDSQHLLFIRKREGIRIVSVPPSSSGREPLTPFPCSGLSHRRQSSTDVSNVNPFPGLQFFMSCSSMGPFHGKQPFRLLQCGFLIQPQVLPANLLGSRLLSPQVHWSFKDIAPACTSHRITVSSRHSPVPACGPSEAASGFWFSLESPRARPVSLTMGYEESQLWYQERLLPVLLLHWPGCLQCCFSHTFSLISSLTIIASAK